MAYKLNLRKCPHFIPQHQSVTTNFQLDDTFWHFLQQNRKMTFPLFDQGSKKFYFFQSWPKGETFLACWATKVTFDPGFTKHVQEWVWFGFLVPVRNQNSSPL